MKSVEQENKEKVKYIERKLTEKGVLRLERHPADGLPLKHDPKKGHGGKYTWEGPDKELEPAPPAFDQKDPNYVDEEGEEELVIGEVEVVKMAEEGVARLDVDPHLNVNN